MKKIVSFVLMLVMCFTLISPVQAMAAQETETTTVSTWAIPDLMFGDTYGIYPLTWYGNGVTGTINHGQFRTLYYGTRLKLVESGCVEEKRFAKPHIDGSMTVEETLEAFYTLLTNYDYTVDMGLNLGLDPVTYMQQIGVYTGQNGEQGLQERCSMEQAMVIATRLTTVVYEALGASSKGFLWEVKSGENTVYLLGSIHLASTDIYPFSSKMWMAYYYSNALVVEANLYDQQDLTALSQVMLYTDGTTLKDHVSADTYEKAISAAALIGIPEAMAAYFKPWALYLTFSNYTVLGAIEGGNASGQLGIDMNFLTNAVVYQKPIYAVESLKKQGEILDSFSQGLQEFLLNTYADILSDSMNGTVSGDAAELEDYMTTLFDSWKTGDTESFMALSASGDEEAFAGEMSTEEKAFSEEYTQKLMTQRDDSMAVYIDSLLKAEGSNTYFVVLGAAHFISDYRVIDRLKEKGYTVNQIK
jgi:uncharacterized protein YbaP (TraB family)